MRRWWAAATRTWSVWLGGVAQVRGLSLHSLAFQTLTFRSTHFLRSLVAMTPALFLLGATHEGVYNILWGLVFAFATLNILSLGARRFEANKRGLSFGEVLAIMIVLISIVLLGWELLYQFQILPLRLTPE